MTDHLPEIEEGVVNAIFIELEKINVELDEDPLEFGPKRLNNKVAETRKHLARCESLFVRVSHWLQLYKRAHRAGQLEFELATQDLLANDPEVRSGRNVKDRDALATVKLRDRRVDLDKLQIIIMDLEALMTVIKSKRTDLRDSQYRLQEQQKLCREEIGLGARWGSRADGNVLSSAPAVDSDMMRDLQSLMNQTTQAAELDLSTVVEEAPQPVAALKIEEPVPAKVQVPEAAKEPEKPAETPFEEVFKGNSSQDDIDSFLDQVDLSPKKPERVSSPTDVSIDDLLADL
jgi:hypothetical protein